MSDDYSLKEDLKKSMLYHVIVAVCVVVYFIFGEMAHLTTQTRRRPERKELATIGVEFVHAQEKSSMQMALKDGDTRRTSEAKSQVNQIDKQDPMKTQKSVEKVDRIALNEMEKRVERSTKKSELQPKTVDILNVETNKKIQKQKKNVVERQVSKIAKESRTATSKIINLNKAVGQKRKVTPTGVHRADLEKSKNTQNTEGVLKQSNAQILAAKEVKSTGAKIIKTAEVKKTVKKLTSKDSEVEKKKQQTLAIEKERQEKYLKQKLEDKQKQLALVEKQRKQELQEKQRKLALAEKQRKQELQEKQRKLALAEKQRKQELAEKQRKHALAEKQRNEEMAEKQRQIRESYEAGQIMKYGQMIVTRIQEVALFTEGMGQLSASLKIKLDTKGFVQGVSLTKTSGNASFDRLAVNAVYKASPLPLPEDEKISEKMASINLKISPNSLE